jgi:phage tail protein X
MIAPFIVPYGGMRLDRIAKAYLQTELLGATEALLEANQGLSDIMVDGTVPEGTAVYPPTVWEQPTTISNVVPWE